MNSKNKIKISTLIVARNEEKNIKACLESLEAADEIILLLDRSTDCTINIAKNFNCTIFEGSWISEGIRRNEGIKKCSHDWILEIDADERASKQLIDEAKNKIIKLEDTTKGYFLVPFDNYIGNKRVRYGWGASWGVTSKPCLFHKNSKIWGDESIHPSLQLNYKQGVLVNRIDHFVDKNISDMIQRLDRYTSAKAIDLRKSSKKLPPLWITVRRSLTRFYKCYITRKGYKEKGWGFLNASFAALFVLISYLKAKLENDQESPKS
ncbi:MAG: glycosyltransferase family 2 protein [Alphaproteobacteria bacterium]|tara:strand:- start:695 stop:1489 length:795 start_codon:yes stop_codon:yes gene_type:complete